MMTKEEYQKNIIRMFDSLRNECTGEKNCGGINCRDCPFYKKVCHANNIIINVYKAIEIVENWAKEHPVKTNAEKFKEVFGTEPPINACVNNIDCENCEYYGDGDCNVRNLFWDAEYKGKTEGCEEE